MAEVVRSGWLAQGDKVAAFEDAIAKVTGQAHGAAVSSGTAALYLALMALGTGPRDEVIIPSYACAALLQAIRQAGARPVPVDIDAATYNLSPAATTRAITARTKAVIVVHSFGLPADVAALKGNGIPLIEDCAQTLGVPAHGAPVGSAGDLTVCSFYATKMITTGEGGMVLGRREALMARVRILRQYDGQATLEPAFNYKMTDVQAALGLCQAARLETFLARRRMIAARYAEAVRQAGGTPPMVPSGGTHGYFRFVVQLSRSVAPVLKQADKLGISCQRPVYKPLHRYLGLSGFPESDAVWERTFSIPIYPALSDDEVDRVVNAIPALLSS